jgi:hypothetical protein
MQTVNEIISPPGTIYNHHKMQISDLFALTMNGESTDFFKTRARMLLVP